MVGPVVCGGGGLGACGLGTCGLEICGLGTCGLGACGLGACGLGCESSAGIGVGRGVGIGVGRGVGTGVGRAGGLAASGGARGAGATIAAGFEVPRGLWVSAGLELARGAGLEAARGATGTTGLAGRVAAVTTGPMVARAGRGSAAALSPALDGRGGRSPAASVGCPRLSEDSGSGIGVTAVSSSCASSSRSIRLIVPRLGCNLPRSALPSSAMCELLGMECNVLTDIVFSFHGLSGRGGRHGPHADGWGLALYEGRVARVFLEPAAAADSPLARFIREHPSKTLLAIAHVRRKTRGEANLANTHPFTREMWGRHFVFAHNGTVKNVRRHKLGRFRPMGKTDSEHAFCALLGALQHDFGDTPPPRGQLAAAIASHAGRIGRDGTFNVLLGDGDQLYARCATKLHHLIRKAPFRKATLADEDLSVDFAAVTTPKDRVAVVATMPLTRDEQWTAGEPNTLWVFREGKLLRTLAS